MMKVETIKQLREETGVGMMECKRALEECNGDVERAKVYLRKVGVVKAGDRGYKVASEGALGVYVHTGNKICAVVEVGCETDFVASSSDFQEFAYNIALHIAASGPRWISRNEVPTEVLDTEREVILASLGSKPDNIKQKIIAGKLNKFYGENCLMEQVYVKDQNRTVEDLYNNLCMRVKEKVVIKSMSRFEVGSE